MARKRVMDVADLVYKVLGASTLAVGALLAIPYARSKFGSTWEDKYEQFKILRNKVEHEYLFVNTGQPESKASNAKGTESGEPEIRLATWVLKNCTGSRPSSCQEVRKMCRDIDELRSKGRGMLLLFQDIESYNWIPFIPKLYVGRISNEATNVLACVAPLDAVNRYARTSAGSPHFTVVGNALKATKEEQLKLPLTWPVVLYTIIVGHDDPNLHIFQLFQKYPDAFPKNFKLPERVEASMNLIPVLRQLQVPEDKLDEFQAWLLARSAK